jgi:hypothetical protein
MELTSLNAVSRVQKTTLSKLNKVDDYSDKRHGLPTKPEALIENDVSKEIVRNLGKYPPIKEKYEAEFTHEEIAKMVKDEAYEPDLESLADSLINVLKL